MFCNSASNKFCNKRNTIGERCIQCKMTIYCSHYCRTKDELSHKRICFTRPEERRNAFLQLVGRYFESPNLSVTYIVLDQKKKRRSAICLHDKPNKSVCIFCLAKNYSTVIRYKEKFCYYICTDCIYKNRYVCGETLLDGENCPGVTFQDCSTLFLMDFPAKDIIYHIITLLRQIPCMGCLDGKRKIETFQREYQWRCV